MASNFPVQNTPSAMRNYEEAVQHVESQCRHGEEVHRSNSFPVIAQKGRPTLRRLRTPRCFPHPPQYTSFRNIESKHLQFAVNARSTPGRVFSNHAKDELAQFRADKFLGRTNTMPREPRPIRFESSAMLSHNSLRLDEYQRLLPSAPNPLQYHPKQSVRGGKLRSRTPSLQDCKLLPKCEIFQAEVATRTTETNPQSGEGPQQTHHKPNFTRSQANLASVPI
jgi:hypothetical protein